MEILGICGSLRQDSINRKVLQNLKDVVPEASSLEIAGLHGIPMFNQDDASPAVVADLSQKIIAADAVVFATPEYNYSVPGVLKNALDWLSRHPDKPFNNKPAGIIGASPGRIGTARAQYHLRQIGVFLNIRFLNKPEVMIGGAMELFDDRGSIKDEKTREHLRSFVEALLAFAIS